MALSHRDRINKMFELAAPAFDGFLTSIFAEHITEETDWTGLVALRDAQKNITGKTYDRRDPQVQLRMLTENIPNQIKPGWYPFDGVMSPVHKSYASELRDARNAWAHNAAFSEDDAYRALDTAERLLSAINGADAADEIRKLRLDLRRVSADRQDKRTLKSAAVNPASADLKPWREVLRPHDDVATGNFQAAEFAADLYKVANNASDQSRDYSDPVEFFARTYLTEGLQDLIGKAVRRLLGDENASPVINLQTNFGGGKTHSMLSLWHLAGARPLGDYPQDVQEILGAKGFADLGKVKRVALVGNHLAPAGEIKPDGTKVNTLWGELAWQLGGADAYATMAEHDEKGTNPGGVLHSLLAEHAPVVILIDEWVAYARQLYGRDDLAGGTFDTQFTFAQSLTEAVKATPGALLAVSIPASHNADDKSEPIPGSAEEVGGTAGLESLKRLQNVVRRVASQWRPASYDEAYRIVKQRLFATEDAQALAEIGATARAFVEFYRANSADFPSESREADYERRIRQSYPIHPELFDRLYEDWSTLERFQRTRGVLRLMNTVIHALWVGEDKGPLILPGSVPMSVSAVNSELTQYLQDSWKSVIDADVDGVNSEPAKIDLAKPLFGQRSTTKRLARTVFFGAAPTIGTAHKGIETQRVFLGTAIPGDVVGHYHSALAQLADRGTYYYSGSGKHWYDLQANITRRAKDQAERLHREDVWAEIVRRLAGQASMRGDFAGVHLCPEDTADIPDTDEARLVILHPRLTHKRKSDKSEAFEFAQKATENKGTANRVNRNMVVYLAADVDRMDELDTAVRNFLGWKAVLDDADELDLSPNQKNQAQDKQRQWSSTADDRLLGAFHWVLNPAQPDPAKPFVIEEIKAEGQAASLAERVSRKLGNDGVLATRHAVRSIRLALDTHLASRWKDGHISVGEMWGYYAQYPYLQRLQDRSVLDAGIIDSSLLWESDGFATADGFDEASERYTGLVLPTDQSAVIVTDQTLVVRPDVALAQRLTDTPPGPDDPTPPTPDVPMPSPSPGPGPVPQPKTLITRFYGTKALTPERYASDFKKIADEVLAQLAAVEGVELEIRIDVEAIARSGFDESKIRTVRENADTLKFDQHGFEER